MNTQFFNLKFIIVITFLTIFSWTVSAQSNSKKYEIGITTGAYTPSVATKDDFKPEKTKLFKNKYFLMLQFYEIPADTKRKEWETKGLTLTDYLPGNIYYSVINENFDLSQLQNEIRAIIDVDYKFKKEAKIYFSSKEDFDKKAKEGKFVISYYATLSADDVIADLKSQGVTVENHRDYSRQLDVIIDINKLDKITDLPYVQFISAQAEDPVLEGYDHRNSSGRTNFVNTGYNGLNYNGAGVVVAIGEGGTVDNLVDVKGRLTEMVTGIAASHKIGVMKNAGGAGNLDPSNRNNAWGATFLSIDVANQSEYSSLYASNNLRYTNHSFGVTIAGGYDQTARDHDLRIASLPNHMVIYSAGNSGTLTGYAPYAYANWANITGMMKQNKNMFAIGALEPDDDLGGFSSRGPMYDGRIIPQLVIEGIEGTSDAAPKITGISAILNQIFKAKNSGSDIPSGLLRAILMNTADDVDNPGPDFKTGYGRPNVRRAYNVINNAQYLQGTIANGGNNAHSITVPANTKQVRVMIVWSDVAAAVNANPAIVNNLNLQATDPSSNTYNPWVLDHSASIAAISAPATRQVDNLNTIEQVTVDNPVAGSWTFNVAGQNVPSGPQTYYLVYEFLQEELSIAFPLENERIVPGTTYYLRWDSYGTSGTFDLSYELDGSGTWTSIVTGYDATKRVYGWIAPTVSGIHTIKFRVQRGGLSSISGVNYIGNVPENFRITKVCSHEVTLKWSPVTGASSYKVYRLGTNYMEEVTLNISFSANSAILTGQSTTGSEYYAVSAVTGSFEGSRTNAIVKVAGDYGCTPISWIGTTSTDWFTTGNWSSGALPLITDNVVIPSTATNMPAINATGAVCKNITIDNGASLTMNPTTAYTLSVSGDWINNGTFNSGIGTVEFSGTNDYQEIGGASTTGFYVLSVAKGAQSRILEATALITLNAANNPLNLASGTFKLSSASTITPFTSGTGADLVSLKGLWNNGGTINSGNFSWFLNAGLIKVSAGTLNIGTSADNTITYLNNGKLIIEGGVMNIAGRFSPNSGTSGGTYTQLGGILTVNTVGSSNTSRAPFELNSSAPFTMTGGTIVIQRASSNATADVIISSTTNLVSGGTLQIGNASTPASQTIRINSTVPVYNLVVNATNSPIAQLVTNNLTVKNDVTILGGTLNANDLNLTVGGQWTNSGTYVAGTGTVTLNGMTPQTIGGSVATTFNNLTIDGADVLLGTTDIIMPTTTNNNLTINTNKKLTVPGNQKMSVGGTFTNNSTQGLKILSTSAGTGSLIANTIAGTGTASIERYLPTNDWHLVSSPVSGLNMKSFAESNSIDQFNGTYDIGTHSEPLGIWNYNVSTGGSTDVFVYGIGNAIRRTVAAGPGTVTFTNPLYTSTPNVAITRANFGWESIGNPFTSPMNVATFLSVNSGQLAASPYNGIYRWDRTDYVSATEGLIALAQGFFVKSKTGGGSVSFTPAMKTHGTDNFKSAEVEWPCITLVANSGNLENKTWIQFNNEMTKGLDNMYDRGKLKGNPDIALFTRLLDDIGVDIETQALPDNGFDKYRIPVGIDLPAGGEVAFTALAKNLPVDVKLFLEDTNTKTFTNLGGPNDNYTVTLEKGTSGFGRFYLLTGDALTTSLPQPEIPDFYVFTRDKTIFINGPATGNTLLELYSIDGKLLYQGKAGSVNQNKIDGNHLPAGIYLLNIKSGGVTQTLKTVLN